MVSIAAVSASSRRASDRMKPSRAAVDWPRSCAAGAEHCAAMRLTTARSAGTPYTISCRLFCNTTGTRCSLAMRYTGNAAAERASLPLSQHSEMSLLTRRLCLSVTGFYLSLSIPHLQRLRGLSSRYIHRLPVFRVARTPSFRRNRTIAQKYPKVQTGLH